MANNVKNAFQNLASKMPQGGGPKLPIAPLLGLGAAAYGGKCLGDGVVIWQRLGSNFQGAAHFLQFRPR